MKTVYGKCCTGHGYEYAACLLLDGRLFCVLCVLQRIQKEAPEIFRVVHFLHYKHHQNIMLGIPWEVAPSNGCGSCDEEIIDAWREVFVPALAKGE